MSHAALTCMPMVAPAVSAYTAASSNCVGLFAAPINSTIGFNPAASIFVTDPFINNDKAKTHVDAGMITKSGIYAFAHLNALLTKHTSKPSNAEKPSKKNSKTVLYCSGLSSISMFAPGMLVRHRESTDTPRNECDDVMVEHVKPQVADAAPVQTDFGRIDFEEHVFSFPPIEGEVTQSDSQSLGQNKGSAIHAKGEKHDKVQASGNREQGVENGGLRGSKPARKNISKENKSGKTRISGRGSAARNRAAELSSKPQRTEVQIKDRTSMTGSRIYLGMSHASNSTRAPHAVPPAIRNVNARQAPAGSTIVMPMRVGGTPARVYFVRTETGLEFAGWEEKEPSRDVMPSRAMLPIPSFNIARYFRGSALGLGTPGGESAPEYQDPTADNDVVAQRFASLVLAQLRMGPNALAGGGALRSLNALIFNSYYADNREAISNEKWEGILHRALGLAVRHTPIFNCKGYRSITSIQDDVCLVLGIDPSTLDDWEDRFGVNIVAEQVFAGQDISDDNSGELEIIKSVIALLDNRVELMANTALGALRTDSMISRSDEVTLHWRTAMISALPNVEDRIGLTKELIAELLQKDKKNLVGRALALIVKNTELDGSRAADDTLVAHWSEADLRMLISGLMKSEMWNVVSHRAFRQHLSPEENKTINKLVYSANYTEAVEQLKSIDVTKVSADDFWRAVDGTGLGDILETDAITRMGLYN